ncbi:hypothetical protein [Paenibacillus arenosi]|uniref:HTH cro/C1-type domain-containing protein n=1 Tax=Paenibacillus arenosi TaxID=2774142 RepID=A0ABR9ATI0_9BACL|nr:hypothetical protein [Paenibacillus arenosi]MBD8497322.1 hypothetical protein [Paenibacillus arenosi]
MKKRSLQSLSKGTGYSTAVFFEYANHGIRLSKFDIRRLLSKVIMT